MSELEERVDLLCDRLDSGQFRDYPEVNEMLECIPTLFAKIAHGEPGHRAWLKEAIECHFLGKPIPEYVAK